MSLYRLSGIAEQVDTRDGKSKATGEAYSIPFINVRVDRLIVTSANVPDGMIDQLKGKVGQKVDLAVDVTASGGYLRAQVIDEWPEDVSTGRRAASPIASAS